MIQRFRYQDRTTLPASPEVHIMSKPVIVIGDSMLDIWCYGRSDRLSPESPVPVVEPMTERIELGGAAHVAKELARDGISTTLITQLGDDEAGRQIRSLAASHFTLDVCTAGHTTTKERIVANGHHICRLDRETRLPLDNRLAQEIAERSARAASGARAVVVSDYAKGVVGSTLVPGVSARADCFVDPKSTDWQRYSGALLIKPNEGELLSALGLRSFDPSTVKLIRNLLSSLNIHWCLVSRGQQEAILIGQNGELETFDVTPREARDVSGAGDVLMAKLVSVYAKGKGLQEAVSAAIKAASASVEHVGTGFGSHHLTTTQEVQD